MIDIIVRDRRCTSWETYGSTRLAALLDCRVICLNTGNFATYLQEVRVAPPRATLSFSTPLSGEAPFCEMTGVPHLLWSASSLARGVDYLGVSLGYVGMHDPKLIGPRRLYLPFGVEKQEERKRCFETVLFESLCDLKELEKTWELLFPGEDVAKWVEAPLLEVPPPYLYFVEQYQRAQRTLEYVEKGGRGHLFGEHLGNNWLCRFPELKLHFILPFSEHFEVLAQTETFVTYAGSPWIGPALATGCRVVDHVGQPLTAPQPSWEEQAERVKAWCRALC